MIKFKFLFQNSFHTAWEAYLQYPDNQTIELELKDVCLWAFYIGHNNLDSSYLTTGVKDEYIVNSVPEEYLIMRRIRINDQYLVFNSQKLISKKRSNYDIINCSIQGSEDSIDLKFKLNWDLSKSFGGITPNTDEIYSNKNIPIFERIGALLVSDSKIDLAKEIEILIDKE